jgi:hypothetical protein
VIAQLEGDCGSPDQGPLGALIVKALHPTPPGASRGRQQLLLAVALMAVAARPRQHHVQAIAGAQLMHGAQRPQRPVAANMQVEILPTRCPHRQAARCSVGGRPAAGVKLNSKSNGAIEDDR